MPVKDVDPSTFTGKDLKVGDSWRHPHGGHHFVVLEVDEARVAVCWNSMTQERAYVDNHKYVMDRKDRLQIRQGTLFTEAL